MTAGELAFLAIGLVLGVAIGSAAFQFLRTRAPAGQVRVTVSPNSIRARRASTLAEPDRPADGGGPARGGPADQRWVDRPIASDVAALSPSTPGPAGAPRTPVLEPSGIESVGLDAAAVVDREAAGRPFTLTGTLPLPAPSARPAERIAIPISMEADPEMASLRAVAAEQRASAGAIATRSQGAAVAGSAAVADSSDGAVAAVGSNGRSLARPVAGPPAEAPGPAVARRRSGGSASHDPAAVTAVPTGEMPAASADPADACAEPRRIADERCAVSTRARDGAREAVGALRAAQRTYDDHVSRAEAEAAAADPRAVRAAKEAAQQAFRHARAAAATRESVEAAARDWLTEINRINHDTREAAGGAERHRSAAAELAGALERLAVEADAARISAEAAEEACVAARETVAECQEAATLAASGVHSAAAVVHVEEAADSIATPMASRAGDDAAIIRLLRGDREVQTRIVAALAGDDEAARRRWQASIAGLLEALVAKAIEASAFEFPADHPFWSLFTRAQSRDIAAALSSLGYRHDGFGGWADDRIPTQRDLSLAVGYAGLDPMRIRHWPADAEMDDLLSGVSVAADEYVWEAAGGLTLGELVSLLGRRADGLTELWNEWGAIRPLLLAGD